MDTKAPILLNTFNYSLHGRDVFLHLSRVSLLLAGSRTCTVQHLAACFTCAP